MDDTKYKKLTQHEHILARPSMYLGPVQADDCDTYVATSENTIVKKNIKYNAGLYKIFDEIVVNAVDHCYRLLSCDATTHQTKNIKVDIKDDWITILNDGDSLPIEVHQDYKVHIPELVFGHLNSGSNYDDEGTERTIGGVNGLGSKCCNIFSKSFTVEIVDTKKQHYQQTFCENMTITQRPVITSSKKSTPFTCIKFLPDYEKFGMSGLSEDMCQLMTKRVLDICAVTPPSVNVFINGSKIASKSFERYVDMYIGGRGEHERFYEKCNDRWEIVVAPNPAGVFEHVSFVNGIWTLKGGKHVDYVAQTIVKALSDHILKRKKITVKPQHIKDNLMLFIKATIVNPTFDSQSKEYLTTPASKFGSKFELSDKFIDKLYKSSIVSNALNVTSTAQASQAAKTDGKKRSTIRGLAKLDDANFAGTNKSNDCTLILTEGDSAKTMALAGISVVGRDHYGVFPLRGKLLNVKDSTITKVSQNEEITSLKKILGLENGKVYDSVNDLRYGKIMIMTDQDSVTGDTPMLVRDPLTKLVHIIPIKDIGFTEWIAPDQESSTKEYSMTGYEVWTDRGWTGIRTVMRHKTTKKIYRVNTPTGSVDVTEDHSLLDGAANKISPTDLRIGNSLMHAFPRDFNSDCQAFTDVEAYIMGMVWADKEKYNHEVVFGVLQKLYADEKVAKDRCAEVFVSLESNDIIHNSDGCVPSHILNAPFDTRSSFLNGICHALCKEDMFVLKGKVAAMSMYYLLRSLGMDPGVEPISNSTFVISRDHIGAPTLVLDIKYMGQTEQYVYDVETINHHFHAGVGQMIVHNTDGSHIKGLIFNMFHTLWPSLLKQHGFIKSMMTPIVKVRKGTNAISFYNLTDYDTWKQECPDAHTWKIKYYKGLGTSTAEEAKEYFKQLNVVEYVYDGDEEIDLAFNKKRADDRKRWMEEYDSQNIIKGEKVVPYSKFILKELAHFSHYDIERSIPSICDGLKPSQRKIMFGVFKRGQGEVKVEQLGGYVSEHAAYHHGETSLHGAIIGLSQDFVGSNNFELLSPIGQFGSRIQGGKDAASPRYIFCDINPLTRDLFIKEDLAILKHLEDDGQVVEPEWYIPIIPLVLVNGANGIGTGFSTQVPNFNPLDVIENVRAFIAGEPMKTLVPWYRGFNGLIAEHPDNKNAFVTKGCYTVVGNTVEITELPIGVWTEDYKHFLEEYIEKNPKVLKDYSSQYTDVKVKFVLQFYPGALDGKDIEKELKLVGKNLSINNIHLINAHGKIHKYATINEVIEEFCNVRLDMYTKRKEHQIAELEKSIAIAKSRVLFIEEVHDKRVDIMNLSKDELVAALEDHHYKVDGGVDYLIRMPMYSLTMDKLQSLRKDIADLEEKLGCLLATTERDMWLRELKVLEDNYAVALQAYIAKQESVEAPVCKRRKKA